MKKYPLILILVVFCIVLCSAKKEEYTGPFEDRQWFRLFDNFGEKIAKRYQMQLLMTGLGQVVEQENGDIIGIAFVDRRNLTIDQARPFILALTDEIWNMMSHSQELEDYRKCEARIFKTEVVPFNLDLMGIKCRILG